MSTTHPIQLPEFMLAVDELAKRRSLGQRELATFAGINESQISRLLRVTRRTTINTAAGIISIFDGDDRRALVVAYLHDIIRALGQKPEDFPIGPGHAPALADIAGPGLAETIITLVDRSNTNYGIIIGLKVIESLSQPASADPERDLNLNGKILPPKKTITRNEAVG